MTDTDKPPASLPGLRETAEATLDRAHAALARAAAEGDVAELIHDFRVAMKRWRALLRLLEPFVGDEARALRREAARLARALAGSRDLQAACDALDDIAGASTVTALPAQTRTLVTHRLEALRRSAEVVSFDDARRTALYDYLAKARAALKRWPLESLTREAVIDALVRSYRRTRRRCPGDWPDAEPAAIHAARKAVVALRYQLELLKPSWPQLWRVWINDMQRLRQSLGKSNDLLLLARLCTPHQPLSRWRHRLHPLIETRRQAHLANARELARRLFAERPRAFHARIAATADSDSGPNPAA